MSFAKSFQPEPDVNAAYGLGAPILQVEMGPHRVVAIKAARYSLARFVAPNGEGFGVMTTALVDGTALYFELEAPGLRDLAAACLNCADKIDGGKGKQ